MIASRTIRMVTYACTIAVATTAPLSAQQLAAGAHPDGVVEAAREAYIYGYPLVSMAMTRRVMTNVMMPQPNGHAPVNQFGNMFTFPTSEFRDVVAPNVNTLYSSAWLDLSREPMIVHLPDTHGRYYVMEMLDAWTDVFAAPGKRTTGTSAQDIAIVGPKWQGQLPPGITKTFMSPTNTAWIVNRIETHGPKDFPTVNAMQRELTLTPLSMYGKHYTPPQGMMNSSINMTTAPMKQVNAMSATEFFTVLAHELMMNPPAVADSAVVLRMGTIGIVPGQEYSTAKMHPAMLKEVQSGAKMGMMEIAKNATTMGRRQNGWTTLTKCGQFGTDYLTRASVAMRGLGCNLPEDAVYPATNMDAMNMTLTGAHRYMIHFAPGQTPPVNAFWSITMYDSSMFLVKNAIDRSSLASFDELKKNPDGSVDLYIQNQAPTTDKQMNWLPAPTGPFVLLMRMYWPKAEALSGAWSPPAVQLLTP